MADKQIVPYGLNLNQLPEEDNSLALVLVSQPGPLATIPPQPKLKTYGKSYFAHVHSSLPSPPKPLFLEDAPPKGPIVRLPADTKLLPPRPNEMLQGAKYDKDDNIIRVNYTTAIKRPTIDGVRAHPSKVKFIAPKEAPKRALPRPQDPNPKPKLKKPTVAVLAHTQDFLIKKMHKLEELIDLVTKNDKVTNQRIDLVENKQKKTDTRVDRLEFRR
jgi:hypothetical protein